MNIVIYGLLIVILVLLAILFRTKVNKVKEPIPDQSNLVELSMQQQDFMNWVERNDRY